MDAKRNADGYQVERAKNQVLKVKLKAKFHLY